MSIHSIRIPLFAALLLAGTAWQAHAHGVAGARVFISTLQFDDPAVADEATLPTASWTRQPASDSAGPSTQLDVSASFSKRITDRFGVSVALGHSWLATGGDKRRNGWQNIELGAKYQAYVNPEHEFMVSVGVNREFARTGTLAIGADTVSTTAPSISFGKGFGDLPIGDLRPLALTGQFGMAVSERGFKRFDDGTDNGGHENRWIGGLSLQYSLAYLQSQVKDYGLPTWLNNLTPLVEVAWSSPARGPSTQPMQLLIAPGVAYSGDWYQVTAEVLIPANHATGRNLGVIAEFHVFFDDIFPKSLGTPVANWFR
ncbi:MAG: hypothetical protein NT133_03240 [Alphaproteobacteria bacterium]|nr:hypothetical protein [Alphaproteobacteria bacterium]